MHKWFANGAWSDWEDRGGLLASAPAAVSWGPNRIDCFYRGLTDRLLLRSWNGAAWLDEKIVGNAVDTAAGVASRAAGSLDCFVRRTEGGHLWHEGFRLAGALTLRSTEWIDLGGILVDGPAAVSWGGNRIDCFAQGTDHALWHIWWGESTPPAGNHIHIGGDEIATATTAVLNP